MPLHLRLSITPPMAAAGTPHRRRFPSFNRPKSRFSSLPLVIRPIGPSTRWRRRCSAPPARPSAVVPADAGDEAVDGGFEDELRRLLVLLPPEMRRMVEDHAELCDLVEVVMDLGRQPLARFPSGDVFLSDRPISYDDLHHATSQVGDFAADNRAGISRTLHRISAIRNRKGTIVGLTCRVGRAVAGSANLLRDLIKDGGSLLLIGPPGVGKTTIIREIARMLADDYKRRVVIVDTSNEIGGDGDIPHAGIGSARRLQVPNPDMQHKVLIEAVENHMPQVIVIDEIGTRLEAMAASTIAQRGIQLVATAHGVAIENLIMNPSLEMLVGGIQSVTLGDEEANRRGGQKTVRERKGPSTFTCGAEIVSKTEIRVHRCLESTVDALLAGRTPNFEICKSDPEGYVNQNLQSGMEYSYNAFSWEQDNIKFDNHSVRFDDKLSDDVSNPRTKQIPWQTDNSHEVSEAFNLFVYGIMETSVQEAVKQLGMDGTIEITNNMSEAAAFLALQSKLKKNPHIHAVARSRGIPIFVTKTNSLVQIIRAMRALVNEHPNGSRASEAEERIISAEEADALEEARLAIEHVVIPRGEPVQLLPRPSNLISIQIEHIEKYKLLWEIVGEEPNVCVRVLPLQSGTKQKNVAERVDKIIDSEDFDNSDGTPFSQNGMTRLPLLPE